MSEPFLGEITMFGGNFAPRGWAMCDGQLLSISNNQALFSILGTTYGGDGRTTFALPELRGRVAMHPGSGPGLSSRSLGEKGGDETISLTVNNMPAHIHSVVAKIKVEKGTPNQTNPANAYPAALSDNTKGYSSVNSGDFMANDAVEITEQSVGNSEALPNMQPFCCVNYIIALQGIFPSRT